MAKGLKGLLRTDFTRYIKPYVEKHECEVCGSDTERLHVHHVVQFQKLLEETLEQLGLEYHEDVDDYTDQQLQLIREVMLGKQLRVDYITCCEPCHIEIHKKESKKNSVVKKEPKEKKVQCRTREVGKEEKVICLNTLEVFDNCSCAAKWCNGQRCGIWFCVKGKRGSHGRHPETKEPLRWMYYDEWLNLQQ